MSKNNQAESLNAIILSLEERKTNEFKSLKDHLRLTGESLKPANLLKSAANELTHNKNLKSYLIQAGIGLAVSLLTKKVVDSTRQNKTSAMISNMAELGLNKLTANQIALIKIAAPLVFSLIFNAIKNRKKKSRK